MRASDWDPIRAEHYGQRLHRRTNRSHEGGASRISCRPSQTGDLSMSPTIAARRPAAVDYERTLILSIEVSNQNWVLAAQVPGLPHTKAKRTVDPEAEALMAAIAGYRSRAAAMGRRIERVIAVYEAGWSGFWLARWLTRHKVEVYVIQPSSVPVDRRMRRAKSDGIDAELLLRTLLAWLRGEPRVCSMVPVPDEAEAFVRRFANGKALGSYAGLTSSPYSSGGIDREQGIGKGGNRRLRTVMVELAWLWTRYQPAAAQVCWFRERVGSTGRRVRKIMVVALARKLLIALWRFVIDGVVPEGAVLKPAA